MYAELGDGLVLVLGVQRGVTGGEVHDGAVSRHHPHPEYVLRPEEEEVMFNYLIDQLTKI